MEVDQAHVLAEKFKKLGYLDKIKQDILTKELESNDGHGNIQDSIKKKVASMVNEMVNVDENLIFKNRGSTSALIEAQIFKNGYKKLGEGEGGIKLDDYILKSVNDERLIDDMKEKIRCLIDDANPK